MQLFCVSKYFYLIGFCTSPCLNANIIELYQVLFSVNLPKEGEEWGHLGNFTAAAKLGEQRFSVEKPVYARYLKFILLSHYGNEFYCTLSQIK